MSNAYSFYPYLVSRELKADITNLRLDGKNNDYLIRNKILHLNEKPWSKAEFNVKIKTEDYEELFSSNDKCEITCIAVISCQETEFRASFSERNSSGKTKFNLEVEIDKRNLSGSASLDVFVLRSETSNSIETQYASIGSQRICVQGEEDYYWSLLIDEPKVSGNDIDLEYVSFKEDDDFGLKDEKDSFYCLKKITTSRPKLFVNTDFKKLVVREVDL